MFTDANLKKVVSQSPVVLFAVDNNGIFQISLGRGLEALGLAQNEVVGLSVFDVYKDMPDVISQVNAALRGDTSTLILELGSSFFESTMSPNIDNDGIQIGIIGLATDITSKIKMQKELEYKNELYDTITQVSKDVVWTMDINGKFTYVSPNVYIIRGFTAEEVMNQTLPEVIYHEDIPIIMNELEEVGKKIAQNITSIPTSFVRIRQPHKSGGLVFTDVQVNTIFDSDGNFKYFLGVTRDITQQMKLELSEIKANKKYELLYEFANDGIFFMRNMQYFDVNKKLCDMLGYSKEELTNMHPRDLSPPLQPDGLNSYEKANDLIQKAIDGYNQTFEWVHLDKYNNAKTMLISLSIVEFEGETTVIGLMRDISQEKEVLAQLQNSEQRLALAIDGSNDGLWDWNMITNDLFLSNRWCEILGYEKSELEQSYHTFTSMIHPEDKNKITTTLSDYIEGIIPKYDIEFRMLHKNGEYIYILARGKIIKDDNDVPIRMIGTHTDITKRKRLQEDISLFFSNSIELVSISKADGYFITLNEMWTKVLGWSKEELMSKPFINFVHKDDISKTTDIMKNIFHGHDVYDFRNRYLCKDGTYKWLSWHSKYLAERGLVFANARDITSQIESEKLLLSLNTDLENKVKERTSELENAYHKLESALHAEKKLTDMQTNFINTISHEYKTPITSISTSAEILKYYYNNENAEAIKNIDRILSSTHALTNLIENVINYQNILDGNYKPFLVPIEINNLIKNLVNQFEIMNSGKFNFKFHALGKNLNLLSDKTSISHIIGEFITNSIKYSPLHTDIVVEIKDYERQLFISVTDSGIGIKEEDIENLYTPFYKSASSIGLNPGSGIGLAVSKKLADYIKAQITLESKPNLGSTFTLILNKY